MDDDERSTNGFVHVEGARQNNLKDVSVSIPRDCLVVFTGVSGSGKSTLAFETIYAEAQRRYLESVAPYARRMIDQIGVPDVDLISGLPPAVALQQSRGGFGARSTVGSVSQISSFLRMLYSRAGDYPAGRPMLTGQDFSPNSPQGACPECQGLGWVYEVLESSMVPNPSLSIREGAVAAWPQAWRGQNFRSVLVTMGYDIDRPWRELPQDVRDWILFTDDEPTAPVYRGLNPEETAAAIRDNLAPSYNGTFKGARRYVLDTLAQTESAAHRARVIRFADVRDCPVCNGKKLKREALDVTYAGLDITELGALSLDALQQTLSDATSATPNSDLSDRARRRSTAEGVSLVAAEEPSARGSLLRHVGPAERRLTAQRVIESIVPRLDTMRDLGLGYLDLNRSTTSLSGGELQRVRLATQVRSNLFGVVYVLDEPTAGLHPADGAALMRALAQIKAAGNSLFVVEHSLDVMRQADWLVDVGPDAGENGGRILYSGPVEGLRNVAESHTADYLFQRVQHPPKVPRPPRGWLRMQGISLNNLQELDCDIPIGVLTAVTGVSGSGKSTLIDKALTHLVRDRLGSSSMEPVLEDDAGLPLPVAGRIVSDLGGIARLVHVDQKPIGRTPRSNLATYTGLFTTVRKLFAETDEARRRGYDAGQFSFNVPKGRCATCEGEGFVTVTLHFMPSVYAPCPSCHGTRYKPETLEVRLKGLNVAEVLNLTVTDAMEFFREQVSIATTLAFLDRVGLSYLRLGQPATELSGGEAQRIKLATELQRGRAGNTLYILDEPSTGLHPADTTRLLAQLDELVDQGNTVVLADHNMRLAASCDWLIDMGPGGGDQGGKVVAYGEPATVAQCALSKTAEYLKL